MALNLLQADKGQEFLCEGFLNLHNLLFPLQTKKLPWKWFVWLSEVALKPVLEPEKLLFLGSGVEDREGLPQGCAHVCSHCGKPQGSCFWCQHCHQLLLHSETNPRRICLLSCAACQALHWCFLMKTGDALWVWDVEAPSCFSGYFFLIIWRNKTVVAIVNFEIYLIVI